MSQESYRGDVLQKIAGLGLVVGGILTLVSNAIFPRADDPSVVVQVLEGEDAVAMNRQVMGATNPADAAPGTIRADFAQSVQANAVHGSDAEETATQEIAFFFSADEICDRSD